MIGPDVFLFQEIHYLGHGFSLLEEGITKQASKHRKAFVRYMTTSLSECNVMKIIRQKFRPLASDLGGRNQRSHERLGSKPIAYAGIPGPD